MKKLVSGSGMSVGRPGRVVLVFSAIAMAVLALPGLAGAGHIGAHATPCDQSATVGGGTLGVSPGPVGPPTSLGWDVGSGQCNGSFSATSSPGFPGGALELALRAEQRRVGQVAKTGTNEYTVLTGPDVGPPPAPARAWWNFQGSIAYGGSIASLDSLTMTIVTDVGPNLPSAPVFDLLALRAFIDARNSQPNATTGFADLYQFSQNPEFGWFSPTSDTDANPTGAFDYSVPGAWRFTIQAVEGATASSVTVCIHTPGVTCVGFSPERAYVPNRGDGTVSVLDSTTSSVVATGTVGTSPTSAVVNHAGTRAYVVNTNSNSVSVIDTSTNNVLTSVTVGSRPIEAAVLPDDSEVYVTNRQSNSVSVIRTSDNTVTHTIAVGGRPHGIVEDPDGSTVYVVNRNTGNVMYIDTTTKAVTTTVGVGSSPLFVALVRQTGGGVPLLYVSNQADGTVSVVDTGTDTETTTIAVGTRPTGVGARRAVQDNPVGDYDDRVYVANEGDGTVSVIDTASDTVIKTTTVAGRPYGAAVDPDGLKVYVGDLVGTQISVLETFSNTLNTQVTVGDDPLAVGRYFTPLDPDMITGTVGGVTVGRVKCTNLTTGQKINVQTTATTFDCETLGLVVSSGDKLRIEVFGDSDGGAFTGSVTGVTPYEVFCKNTDTGAVGRCKFALGCLPPEAWTCSALNGLPNGTGAGFTAVMGDNSRLRLFGIVD